MKSFSGKIAVITGGGTGIGRELAKALIAEGCHVALCDVSSANMQETVALCKVDAPQGVRITSFHCDVSSRDEMSAFSDHVRTTFETDYINLLFNNAGVIGGGSFVVEDEVHWERTFNVCWGGVYNGTRVFMPMLSASQEGHIINTSSINGFWASMGANSAHTAYSSAKFAVKGFTEALITDLRLHAPHVKATVVMPGHIGTSIMLNGTGSEGDNGRRTVGRMFGMDVDNMSDDQIAATIETAGTAFRDDAPTSVEHAVQVILDAVKTERWRVLIGDDAVSLDALVRAHPEEAYESNFFSLKDDRT